MSVTQRERVLQYVQENGSITRLEAAQELGCFELASRIGELEAEGWRFIRQRQSGKNRYGDTVSFMKYIYAGDVNAKIETVMKITVPVGCTRTEAENIGWKVLKAMHGAPDMQLKFFDTNGKEVY